MGLRPGIGCALAALVFAAPAGAAGPAPLSRDATPADVASAYGSGNFGAWQVDGFGLPAFRYDVDQTTDPRAAQPEMNGRRGAQHQLGNDNIKGMAWNDGHTVLWSQARLSQWANVYEGDDLHYAGGFGWLNAGGGKVLSTYWPDRAQGAKIERHFGVGYARKTMRAEGLEVQEDTYAPFGDDPVLLHDVTVRNLGTQRRDVSWFEYWDVNPYDRTHHHNRGLRATRWDAERRTLAVQQEVDSADTRPMTIFAAPLRGPVDGFDTLLPTFFGVGGRAKPDAVAADRLSGTLAPPAPAGAAGQTLFAFRAPLSLKPGEAVKLRYVYGMAHEEQVAGLVERYRAAADPLAASTKSWRHWLPRGDFGAANRWVARELQWAAYSLRSATVWEEECGAHTITQGGYYQYVVGANLGYRSWLHYLLPIVWSEPELAREILRYAIKLQPEAGDAVPYGTGPLCERFDLGTSNDLDFWLLLSAGEYGLGMRDPQFFDEPLPFYDTKRTVSAWEHVKRSYYHQESMRGPNGGYIMGTTGDWSDFATPLGPMTESNLVAAQLAYAYPKLADLAQMRGDSAFAAEVRGRAAELRTSVAATWTEAPAGPSHGWYLRGWFGTKPIGKGVPYGEPQPWAILAGVPTPERAKTLVASVRRFLTGVGAPEGPSKIGSAMAPARNDPEITERGPAVDPTEGKFPDALGVALDQVPNAPFAGAAAYPGGVWFDINGHLTWALASLDGVVPGARDLAWDEYTRNSLAKHADAFPDHWNGTISVDDACNAWYSSDPSRCGIGVPFYAGQITEQPTWMVMNAVRLAGVTPTARGWRVAPHLPMQRFSLRLPRVGVAGTPTSLRGYVKPERGGTEELRVVVPASASGIRAYAGGREVPLRREGDAVVFALSTRAATATDWAVTWS